MIKIDKLELCIISVALILALLVTGLFWALNRGGSDTLTMADTPKSLASETVPTDPLIAEQSTVTHQGLAKLTEPAAVKALVLGDAVAESQGASNRDEFGWHAIILKDLNDKYPGNLQWFFKTTTDATINEVLTYVPEVTQETDLVVLCLGRDDWKTIKLTEFKQKYEQLIVELKAKSPEADIFLIVEPPLKDVAANNRFFPIRKLILDLGQKHDLPVLDQWSAFINDQTPLDGLLVDGVNPNDKGYKVFADEVLKGFEEYLRLN